MIDLNLDEYFLNRFPNKESVVSYLEEMRWGIGFVCPFCGHKVAYKLNDGVTRKCASSKCYKKFTVFIGTLFQYGNVPINKRLFQMLLIVSDKKIKSTKLSYKVSTIQRTAWVFRKIVLEEIKKIEMTGNVFQDFSTLVKHFLSTKKVNKYSHYIPSAGKYRKVV